MSVSLSALRLLPSLCALSLSCTLLVSHAADTPLMQGAGVAITTADLHKELQRMPPEMRAEYLGSAQALGEVVGTMYLRRALATRAEQQGLQRQPKTAYELQSLREGVLADAEAARVIDAVQPDDATLEQRARSIYQGEPARFQVPAQQRASHILIKGRDDAAKARAQKLLDDLKAGADFEALAKQYSEDPGSAARSGDLGWFGKGKMVAPFEAAVEALQQPGALSPLVATQFGWHIIRLQERKPATTRSYEEVRDTLKAEVLTDLRKQARSGLLNDLREQSKGDATALEAFMAEEKAKLPAAAESKPQ